MSMHPKDSWLERWWPALIIAFGVICIVCLDVCHPVL
jgi:hypothetical protein